MSKVVATVERILMDEYYTHVFFNMPVKEIFVEIMDGRFSKSHDRKIFLNAAYEEEDIKNMLKYSKKHKNVTIDLDKVFPTTYTPKFRRLFPHPRCRFTHGHWISPKSNFPKALLYRHEGRVEEICGT